MTATDRTTPGRPKITAEAVARTALELLDEVGLDGLTMRRVATRLDVAGSALYWHVRNKQQLLDLMSTITLTDAVGSVESPRRGVSWEDWAVDLAFRLRRALLRHRDGARVFAGTSTADPVALRTSELALAAMTDAGFSLVDAGRGFPLLLHHVVGFTIEEQARLGQAYDGENPHETAALIAAVDAERFPLTARSRETLYGPDADADFERGLRVILAGLRATYL
ncbi:MAG: TetR/AcrR family transcriptional regulator C-terminal domain-containing protein [Pseudonocardia sp.]|nr:TetR/AcrR family transcriptional regulator C-terminal domain-containing protein [Pseudonocardia sp.]